jgi:hypothetical protein
MERITARLDAIGLALARLTPRLRELAACDFVVGADPGWIGLHRWTHSNGVVLADSAHVAWCCHQAHLPRGDRVPTVVLPDHEYVTVAVVLHELGHVIDERIGFNRHDPDPVSMWARVNRYEAFAEAFELWIAPDLATAAWKKSDRDTRRRSPHTRTVGGARRRSLTVAAAAVTMRASLWGRACGQGAS